MIHETKQVYYNRVKGSIVEINDTENFPSVTLEVGHNRSRHINVLFKKDKIKELIKDYQIGEDICLTFFVSSRFKHERWYTNVNCIEFSPKKDAPNGTSS